MYITLSLLLSAAVTLFVVSKIADFFLAKRPEIKWVMLAILGSVFISFVTYIGLTVTIAWLDLSVTDQSLTLTNLYPVTVLGISGTIIILLSSIAFKVINQMCWPSAITTNFISVAIIAIALTGSFSLKNNGSDELVTVKTAPIEKAIDKSRSLAKIR